MRGAISICPVENPDLLSPCPLGGGDGRTHGISFDAAVSETACETVSESVGGG